MARVPLLGFDELEPGREIRVGSMRLDPEECVAFARRWEPQPHHVDAAAAERSIYGGLTVCSLYLFAVCTRLFFDCEEPMAVLAMLGKDEIRLPSPARPGEVLRYTTRCIEKRPSRSKPDRGIVVLQDALRSERGDLVLSQKVTLLLARLPAPGAAG